MSGNKHTYKANVTSNLANNVALWFLILFCSFLLFLSLFGILGPGPGGYISLTTKLFTSFLASSALFLSSYWLLYFKNLWFITRLLLYFFLGGVVFFTAALTTHGCWLILIAFLSCFELLFYFLWKNKKQCASLGLLFIAILLLILISSHIAF